jgi:hypothetical protein
MEFRKVISPKSQAATERRRAAVMEFQEDTPEGQAATLLNAARKMRESGAFSDDPRYSYDEWALYRVVPELALKLDPSIELQAAENPDEKEREDQVTWLRCAPAERLESAVKSILSNASFSRIRAHGDEMNDTADATFGFNVNCLSVAADIIFPGLAPKRETADDRAPLSGQYVLCCHKSGYDRVMQYSEDPVEIEKVYDALIRITAGEEVRDEDAWVEERLSWYPMLKQEGPNGRERLSSIEVQDSSGEVLRAHSLEREPDDTPQMA